ncbi:cytochrome P450 [Mycena belliarum]|uniref:Cytochrome P450 n=1 Tax=Mycena belliarum TaxID=1033014 RepID=A0AAD6XYF5_9AGAR|nr:cytochrome P450 [Mycena belliae]
MSSVALATSVWILLLAGGLYGLRLRFARAKLPLPPGPTKLPLVGHLFTVPSAFEWETYQKWSRRYNSDIIHLDVAGTSVIVLSSLEAASTLLEKRSAIYSDRPSQPMLIDLIGWGFHIGELTAYSLRKHRRLFHEGFNVAESRKFQPKELAATRKLLLRLLRTPDDFRMHLKQMTGEVIISIAYGIEVLPVDDPYIVLAEQAAQVGHIAAIPGRFLVDWIPLLKHVPDWFPGADFKRQAKESRKFAQAMYDVPFAETKRQLASGTAPHSFATASLQHLEEGGEKYYDEDTIKATSASMYLAGSHSTVTALMNFVIAMLVNPAAQKKAQAEIDSVIGKSRLPSFEDESALPYVSALVKEVLRWRTVAPLGAPHLSTTDDEYRGYRIPAGSTIYANIWAILHDEAVYPDPFNFEPERFLLNGKLNPEIPDPQVTFGFGRRICPARYMAASSVWIVIASILSSFEITKAVGEDKRVIEPLFAFTSGIVSAPLPFECSIRPRSKAAVALVEATAKE